MGHNPKDGEDKDRGPPRTWDTSKWEEQSDDEDGNYYILWLSLKHIGRFRRTYA